VQYQGAEFLFIGWEELTQFTYAQWDFLKGSNRCPIKTYRYKGCEYAVRPRMADGTNPNGIGSGWVKALWITKKPVGEMAAKCDPTEYEAIHSTYEDNYVYAQDKDYISKLNSIVDPGAAGRVDPGRLEHSCRPVFSELGSGAACQKLQSVCLRILAAAMDVD
jgi:hypothetical protein